MYFLDTNAAVWLFQGEVEKFPNSTKRLLEEGDLFLSPMVKLELQYLYEVGRTLLNASVVVDGLQDSLGILIHNVPLAMLIEASLKENWTRDPFDRLIIAHASLEKAPLITRDKNILKHYRRAKWE